MKTETKILHTPGPWRIEGEIFVDGPDGLSIFGGASTRRPDGECAANARLIAAAPELLAVLKMAIPYLFNAPLEGALDVWEKAVAVRDKATGT